METYLVNVNVYGTNAQTNFDKRRNPKRVLMVVKFRNYFHFRLLPGNRFRRIEAVYQYIQILPS